MSSQLKTLGKFKMFNRSSTNSNGDGEEQFSHIRRNHGILARVVPVISPEGKSLGVLPTAEALMRAREAHLDLVEVAPNARPPGCRIMDFWKYVRDQKKKDQGDDQLWT